MALRNTTTKFGSIAKFFHWTIAFLVIALLCVGVSFQFIEKYPFFGTVMQIHKSTGMTLFLLLVLNSIWYFINPRPLLPNSMPAWEKIAARLTHRLLYLSTLLMPLSGMIMAQSEGYPLVFWWWIHFTLPGVPVNAHWGQVMSESHKVLAWIIAGLVFLHILAALKHHFFDKDDVLKRMLPKC